MSKTEERAIYCIDDCRAFEDLIDSQHFDVWTR